MGTPVVGMTTGAGGNIAVIGGTASGIALARMLGAHGRSVDVFASGFDPARSVHAAHPLCEYAPPHVHAADAPEWLRRRGVIDQDGRLRCAPSLVAAIAAESRDPTGRQTLVRSRTEQPIALVRSTTNSWFVRDVLGAELGPYTTVVMTHDAALRTARKAAAKALLESALPHSGPIMASLARAVSASAVAAIVEFAPGAVPRTVSDALVIDGVPELRLASRHPDDASNRGLRTRRTGEAWTLVSTPAFARHVRSSPGGKWDKAAAAKSLVQAFAAHVGKTDATSHWRLVVPCFLWQGAAPLTRVVPGTPPFALDAESGLGFCGDIFAGVGIVAGIRSGEAIATALLTQVPTTHLPGARAWEFRPEADGDEDIACITGLDTGRAEPQDGLDHTWPAAVKLAHGAKLDNADSLAKYRRRGVEDHDRKVALAMAEPTAAPRDDARAPPRRARRRSARKKLDILMR